MKCLGVLFLLVAVAPQAQSADWPHWRGPNFNGSTDEKNLPSLWSTSEKVVWSAPLPGPSASTPVVSGNYVYVSSTDSSAGSVNALCFDRRAGKQLWERKVDAQVRRDVRSTYAAPSPVTDGKIVVFFYGTGETRAFDPSGDQLWTRNVQKEYGEFAFGWTFASSPLLFDGKLFLQVLQRDVPVEGRGLKDRKNKSYILALNPSTGETLWRHIRPSQAVAESREAFTSPVPFEYGGVKQLLVIGGDDLTGHDPADGKEVWRWGTWNPTRKVHWRHVPSPVANAGVILVCAPKTDPIYAIKTGGSGQLDETAVAWSSKDAREITSDVPTPAYYDGDFFVLSDLKKALSRVVPSTGKVQWSVRTPGNKKYEASPLAADGKIYIVNFLGEVAVLNASDGKLVNVIPMAADESRESPIRSSIIAAHGQLFIRTNEKLFCVAN